MTINVNEILNGYNEEDREYVIGMMKWMVVVQAIKAPETDEEFKSFCEETLKQRDEEKRKEEERKVKAEKRERENAEALGMTVEEYRTHKKLQAKIRRYEREIAEAEEEVKKLQKEIERKRRFIEEMKG